MTSDFRQLRDTEIVLGPPKGGPTLEEVEAGVEAFLTRWPAGEADSEGRTGLARDVAAAISAAEALEQSQTESTIEWLTHASRSRKPCPARINGPFLTSDATYLQCGRQEGHHGDHRALVEWSSDVPPVPPSESTDLQGEQGA